MKKKNYKAVRYTKGPFTNQLGLKNSQLTKQKKKDVF